MSKVSEKRGDATRSALLTAAIDIFGRDGFHAASTREIAAQAQANQAAIGYHFGGKDGLYLAAIEHIAERIGERIGPVAKDIEARYGNINGTNTEAASAKKTYLALLLQLLKGFLQMLVDQESSSWAKLILREQQSPTPAFAIFYEGMMGKVMQLTTLLIGRIRGIDADSEAARLQAIMVLGQVIVFRASREAVLRYMGWSEINGERLEMVQSLLESNITKMLNNG